MFSRPGTTTAKYDLDSINFTATTTTGSIHDKTNFDCSGSYDEECSISSDYSDSFLGSESLALSALSDKSASVVATATPTQTLKSFQKAPTYVTCLNNTKDELPKASNCLSSGISQDSLLAVSRNSKHRNRDANSRTIQHHTLDNQKKLQNVNVSAVQPTTNNTSKMEKKKHNKYFGSKDSIKNTPISAQNILASPDAQLSAFSDLNRNASVVSQFHGTISHLSNKGIIASSNASSTVVSAALKSPQVSIQLMSATATTASNNPTGADSGSIFFVTMSSANADINSPRPGSISQPQSGVVLGDVTYNNRISSFRNNHLSKIDTVLDTSNLDNTKVVELSTIEEDDNINTNSKRKKSTKSLKSQSKERRCKKKRKSSHPIKGKEQNTHYKNSHKSFNPSSKDIKSNSTNELLYGIDPIHTPMPGYEKEINKSLVEEDSSELRAYIELVQETKGSLESTTDNAQHVKPAERSSNDLKTTGKKYKSYAEAASASLDPPEDIFSNTASNNLKKDSENSSSWKIEQGTKTESTQSKNFRSKLSSVPRHRMKFLRKMSANLKPAPTSNGKLSLLRTSIKPEEKFVYEENDFSNEKQENEIHTNLYPKSNKHIISRSLTLPASAKLNSGGILGSAKTGSPRSSVGLSVNDSTGLESGSGFSNTDRYSRYRNKAEFLKQKQLDLSQEKSNIFPLKSALVKKDEDSISGYEIFKMSSLSKSIKGLKRSLSKITRVNTEYNRGTARLSAVDSSLFKVFEKDEENNINIAKISESEIDNNNNIANAVSNTPRESVKFKKSHTNSKKSKNNKKNRKSERRHLKKITSELEDMNTKNIVEENYDDKGTSLSNIQCNTTQVQRKRSFISKITRNASKKMTRNLLSFSRNNSIKNVPIPKTYYSSGNITQEDEDDDHFSFEEGGEKTLFKRGSLIEEEDFDKTFAEDEDDADDNSEESFDSESSIDEAAFKRSTSMLPRNNSFTTPSAKLIEYPIREEIQKKNNQTHGKKEKSFKTKNPSPFFDIKTEINVGQDLQTNFERELKKHSKYNFTTDSLPLPVLRSDDDATTIASLGSEKKTRKGSQAHRLSKSKTETIPSEPDTTATTVAEPSKRINKISKSKEERQAKRQERKKRRELKQQQRKLGMNIKMGIPSAGTISSVNDDFNIYDTNWKRKHKKSLKVSQERFAHTNGY